MRALALLMALPALAGPQTEKDPPPSPIAVQAFDTLRDASGRSLFGEWSTWILDVENKSPRDLPLTIRLLAETGGLRATRRETLSHGARKRFFFYLPEGAGAASGLGMGYEILDGEGRKLASKAAGESKGPMEPDAFQIGLFSGDKGSTGAFGFPSQVWRKDVGVFRLGARNFPDRWIGLAPLDVILLHDAPLDDLSPDQIQALKDYVKGGGTAILSPGPDAAWFRHPAIASLAVIRVGAASQQKTLPSLNTAFGPFTPETPFLLHRIENGSALDWEREVLHFPSGLGRVRVFPFDLRRPPFIGWGGLDAFWTKMLTELPRRFVPETTPFLPASTSESVSSLFQTTTLFVNPYPPFLLLVGIAVLFLAAVGPVNYLVLRRLGMTILIVVTVPLISGVFLGLIFGIGYVLKGTSTVAYSVRILSTRPGADTARETQLYTLFSPSTHSYEVTLAPGTWALPLDRATLSVSEHLRYRGGRETSSGRLDVEQDIGVTYKNVGVGQWQSWNLYGRATRDLGGGIVWETVDNRLRITNRSPVTIRRGLLLQPGLTGFVAPFGPLAPGKSVETEAPQRDAYQALGLSRESFEGLMLAPTLDTFMMTLGRSAEEGVLQTGQTLLCLLDDPEGSIRVDARLSGDSRNLTILHVTEAGATR